jgi:antitoxin component YwqK of YwqJK toxin-antitoxin module
LDVQRTIVPKLGPLKALQYENGKLEEKGNHINGEWDGVIELYKEDGTFDSKLEYENGKEKQIP